ncbi:MAG: BatD family protein [Thiogranum sp.]
MAKSFARLLLLAILATISARAPAWYPPYGYQQPGSYPGQYPDKRSPAQPRPYWHPYQQQAQQHSYTPPRVKISVSDTTPYEQQSLVYRVRIISKGNLKIVAPAIPQSSAAILRLLGDPVTESIEQNGAREFATEYRYLLMPLSSGSIEIPPARVTGRFTASDGGDGPAFDVSGEAVIMHVRPATDAVQPWLPLYNLQITARVRGNEAPAAGNPIEMEIETRATGATGSQIPSIAAYLKSTDFRIYPGDSVSEGKLSDDGRTLLGVRRESFTLVPRYGGWLHLPGVTINWWNVRYNRPEVAALLTDRINVMGPANPERGGRGNGGAVSSAFYWLPMGFAVAVLLFGWLSAFMGDGRLPGAGSLRNLFRPLLGTLYTPLVAVAERLSPRRSFHRLRTWTGRRLPMSWKLWFCLRAVARESDPTEWAQALQFLAARHLGAKPQAHLRQLGKTIARCHPRANAEQVDRLLLELDEAVYGNRPIDAFPRWKREFRKQIKPGLFPMRLRQCGTATRSSAQLPDLNPQ